jgi:hypothetical protein
VLEHQFQRRPPDDLESRDIVARDIAQASEQGDGGGRIGHRHPGRGARARARKQLQRRRRDQTQAAFGADEKLLEVVACVVLAQAAQSVPDASVGQHHFQAQAEFAGVAVAQHLHAAGIGRQVAADGGAAFGGEREREQAVGLARRFLHGMQSATGLDGDGIVVGIDGADAVEARQHHHHLAADRRGAAAQPGIAALRHNARPGVGAGADHRGNFLGAAGQHHATRVAGVAAAPVGAEGGHVVRLRQHARRTDDAAQTILKVGAHGTAMVGPSCA